MSPVIALPEVDRIAITTVVDNWLDMLRADEKVARRFSIPRARGMTKVRAEHGLAHWVEISRGTETHRIAFDFGLTDGCYVHNFRELGLDPGTIDALALSHGHLDHFGGLPGFLDACRRSMRRDLAFYAGVDHFLPRWFERDGQRVYFGRLDRDALERQDLAVTVVSAPTVLPQGVALSGEMHEAEPFETIPPSLRVERDGQVVQDTFIGEQTLIANVRGRGLVVVTSCSHRGVIGICRHATRITGIPKIHAVVGGFHLSGLGEDRIAQVVEVFTELGVDYIIPQHCTGLEALMTLAHRLKTQMVVSSVGSTFTFGA